MTDIIIKLNALWVMARWSSGLRLRPLTPATRVRISYGSPKPLLAESVLITVRVHPFPSRTRKLSSLVPKILGWRRPGTIGRRQHQSSHPIGWLFFYNFICFFAVFAQPRQICVAQLRAGRMFCNKPETTSMQRFCRSPLFFCTVFYIMLFSALKHKVIKVQTGVIV